MLLENIGYPLLALSIMLAVWAIAALCVDDKFVLPAPASVLERFFRLGGERMFWRSVGSTLLRTFLCFAISFVCALGMAALGSLCKPLHKLLSPVVSFLRAAPTVAVILVLYAFMQREELAVLVGFLIAFPLMYSAFYSAINGVDGDLLDMAKLYKVRAVDKVFCIYLPMIAPALFDTSRSTLSLTLKVVIAAEILTNIAYSIGGRIQYAYSTFADLPFLLAWTLIAIVFSFVLEGAVSLLKKLWEVTR